MLCLPLNRPECRHADQAHGYAVHAVWSHPLSRRHINWSKEPVPKADRRSRRPWPGTATAVMAYRELRSQMWGLHVPKASVTQLPLWDTVVFSRDTAATHQGPTLIRKCVFKIADLLKDGAPDETILAAAWRPHYRDEVRRSMTWAHSPHDGPQRVGPLLPELEHWKLSKVVTAMAAARTPDERQPEAVWKARGKPDCPGTCTWWSETSCGRNCL